MKAPSACVVSLLSMALTWKTSPYTGDGVIDGSGQAWRPVKKIKMTTPQWQALVESGGVLNAEQDIWWPNEAALHGQATLEELRRLNAPLSDYASVRAYLRPVMVSLVRCKNVLLLGTDLSELTRLEHPPASVRKPHRA